MDIYRSFIHNCQNLEETKKSFTGWTDKLWYIQTMEYYSEPKKIKSYKALKRHDENWNAYHSVKNASEKAGFQVYDFLEKAKLKT